MTRTAVNRLATMCTRVLWSSEGSPGEGTVLIGRSIDWMVDTASNMWAFPAGLVHEGSLAENSLSWTSKYGSVMATMYDVLAVDGVNTEGLGVNTLYLTEADYGIRDLVRPGLSIGIVAQYLLDNFATVAEAVDWFRTSRVQMIGTTVGAEKEPGVAHVSLADESGDSAVVEFLDGETVIHHSPAFQVMTNSPTFAEQLENIAPYLPFTQLQELPGSSTSPDRFVRASYYTDQLPTTSDYRTAAANVLSVIRNASVPYGVDDPEHPNIAATRWRVLSDLTNRVYYYDSTLIPSLFWVALEDLALSVGAPVLKLDIVSGGDRAGDQAEQFVATEGFPPA
ncbi:linear amide C-N hydrolase [soil metagenome]